jgi:hypothetical protein
MTTAAEYRQYADECLVAMRAAMIPEVRAALSTAAQRWAALADEREQSDRPARARRRHVDARETGALAQS